jgi:hypothetical protein
MYSIPLTARPDIFEPGTFYNSQIKAKFGTQTIIVRQTDPNIHINLTDIIPPFSHIGTDQLIKYQVAFFDFPTNNK